MFRIKTFLKNNLLTEVSRIDEATDMVSLVAKLPSGTPADSLTGRIMQELSKLGIPARGKYPARFDIFDKNEKEASGIWVQPKYRKQAEEILKKKFPRLEFDQV